jgi:FMN phosphatase YigB (HAD superfamily)
MFSRLLCFLRSKSYTSTLSKKLPPSSSTSATLPDDVGTTHSTVEATSQGGASPSLSEPRALILDLGDVLFHWSTRELKALTPSIFHSVILTPTWGELECGRITEDEALETIGEELSLKSDTIREAFSQCRRTLRVDHELYAQLVELKQQTEGLKVYAMTNIAKDDFQRLKAVLPSWDLFDAEFTSFEVGLIKPELGYYQHVLQSVVIDNPASAIFIDDKVVSKYACPM